MGFLSNRQPEECEPSPHRLRPHYESVRRFQTKIEDQKFLVKKVAIFTRRVPVQNVKTLKTWLWVFSATKNLRNVKLHHIDYDPNMSLLDDFRQNWRPKVFSEKISVFHEARTCRQCQNPKNLIIGFLSNSQPEECETSPHRLRPQYESVQIEDQNLLAKKEQIFLGAELSKLAKPWKLDYGFSQQ